MPCIYIFLNIRVGRSERYLLKVKMYEQINTDKYKDSTNITINFKVIV